MAPAEHAGTVERNRFDNWSLPSFTVENWKESKDAATCNYTGTAESAERESAEGASNLLHGLLRSILIEQISAGGQRDRLLC